MNAVEIEEAVSELASKPFDRTEFPFAFLAAFGNKPTTIARLRSGSNASDIPGAILQRNNIHIATCAEGETARAVEALKLSPKTTAAKARFVVATDGITFQAEDLASDDPPVICDYTNFPNHFGFFLPLAGISTVKQIRESAFDVRATGRLNKLYLELRKNNPDWDTPDRQHDMNHFMARLIFCFFAEDTDIFNGDGLFTATIDQMSAPDGSNVHEIIEQIFRAMNTKWDDRKALSFRPWAEAFPYVNGGLFAGSTEVPRFTKLARAFLINIGTLEWRKINPDIFGSMIQAVADEEERGDLGMHYTSVPNILKVLNPLFLDDLRAKLVDAGDNPRTLLNLRRRMARIRVFDPACGSGNFLVIAYKEMRAIEAEINKRRGEEGRITEIPITNFRGIEIFDFPAEIARLALIIAEYQCDVIYRGQMEAIKEFLPLDTDNWITCENALRVDWLSVCPATGMGVKYQPEDLFSTTLDQAQIDFENEGGETYICGNPPFKGARKQNRSQKEDMEFVFGGGHAYKDCDYVVAWYLKAADYSQKTKTDFAFVSTNSIARGEQVEHIWSHLFSIGCSISFCYPQFKWSNNASFNAGVWCVIIGISMQPAGYRKIFSETQVREVQSISPYLIPGGPSLIRQVDRSLYPEMPKLVSGSMARDGGHLILTDAEKLSLESEYPECKSFLRPLIGTTELRQGTRRWCLWIDITQLPTAMGIPTIAKRIEMVRAFRNKSKAKTTKGYARIPHMFAQRAHQSGPSIVMPKNTVEGIPYLTPAFFESGTVTTDLAFVAFTKELWTFSLLASSLHRVWAEAISGGLGSGIRYSSQITYNAFPVPHLTEQNKVDLINCAEGILLAREANYPSTIAELYDPESMPENLREAHQRNDEVLERIYVGRRLRNDTERLENLFELYTKMIASVPTTKVRRSRGSA